MQFDAQIQTLTQDEIVPKVVDQSLDSNVGSMTILAQNSRPWSGETMKFPIKTAKGTQSGSFTDFSTFKVANENVRQMTEFDPRAYYASVVLGGIAMSVNNISKTQLLNLVKVNMESILQDMMDDQGDLFYGSSNGSDDFHSVLDSIDDTAVYGGLDPASYSVWASDIQTSVGAWDFTKARNLWNSCTVGNSKPTIAICNETVFGYVEKDYTSTVQGNYNVLEANRAMLTRKGISKDTRMGLTGQMGFSVLYYDGTAIVRDEKAPSQGMLALNLPYYRWYGVKAVHATPVDLAAKYHEGNDYDASGTMGIGFNWTGFVKPHNQYAFIGQFLQIGDYITPARRLHSRSEGISS